MKEAVDSEANRTQALAKFGTMLYVINDLLGEKGLAQAGLPKLKAAFATFATNKQKYPLVYESMRPNLFQLVMKLLTCVLRCLGWTCLLCFLRNWKLWGRFRQYLLQRPPLSLWLPHSSSGLYCVS